LFGFVKTGLMFGAVCYVKERNDLAGCRLWICLICLMFNWSNYEYLLIRLKPEVVGIRACLFTTQSVTDWSNGGVCLCNIITGYAMVETAS